VNDLVSRLSRYQRREGEGYTEETGMLSHDGHPLFYAMAFPREARGPWGVVISHSFFEMFILQRSEMVLLRRFAADGVPAIYVQAPGMGDSEGVARDCRVADRVDAARVAADHLRSTQGIGSICFFGARLGGLVAALAAQRSAEETSLCVWDPVLDQGVYWKQVSRLERVAAALGRKTGFDEPSRRLQRDGRTTVLGVETTPDQLSDLESAVSELQRNGRIDGAGLSVALDAASSEATRSRLEPLLSGGLESVTLGLRDSWQLGLRKGEMAIPPTLSWVSRLGN
jgi:alpha-beta hydrolase superfamily lysophospholipase